MAVRLSKQQEENKPERSIRQLPLLILLIIAVVFLYESSFMMSSRAFLEGEKRKPESVAEQIPLTDSTVIITSSLIPTHPSIRMVNETVNSIREMIGGLAYNTPILISVDGRKEYNKEDIERLQKYVENLRMRFLHDPYVTILNNYQFGHISNSIRVALQMVETEFVYVVQHDFKFIKPINHTSLVGVMREHPDQIKMVRFGKNRFRGDVLDVCDEYNKLDSVKYGIYLVLAQWSDNNHFTTKKHYDRILKDIGPTPRPVEAPMMGHLVLNATSDCTYLLQYTYNWMQGPFIGHLDGRLTLQRK
ncbi:unnamed protein product [Cylindrotheca closterium]|uniref:Uncharacterized protein n=1 Tax=Cylindrotheca closterium TaxID=2856 RepID=A0AAD2CRT5_9STRA|nr:unnamed protein product [Cylindrotheca closterium]